MDIIPNIICEGVGETHLAERILPWTGQATQWFAQNISPLDTARRDESLSATADRIIDTYALWLAAPALDVTMHPNGLAVVQTDNLAPASSDRSRAFRESLMRLLIEQLQTFIPRLSEIGEWRASHPARDIWYATTFHTPRQICEAALLPLQWDSIPQAVARIRSAEEKHEITVWSRPMLDYLRQFDPQPTAGPETPEGFVSNLHELMRGYIRNTARDIIRIDYPVSGDDPWLRVSLEMNLIDRRRKYVELCKKYKGLTQPWHNSKTARLYNLPLFRNRKQSPGYFF